MKINHRFSAKYWHPIRDSLCIQVIFIAFGALCLDMGEMAFVTLVALGGFWSGALTIMFRRPTTPTRFDLEAIRFGYLMSVFLSFWLVPVVRDWRGL